MPSKTQTVANGEKTSKHTRHSALFIQNKDPNFDYSMRRKKEIEDGGGQDIHGYEPVCARNYNGEVFGSFPFKRQVSKTKGSKQYVYHDTILCKRPVEVTKYFKDLEDERYNSQVMHVRNAAKNARAAINGMGGDGTFVSKSSFAGPGMTQRKGPTEE